MIKEIQQTSLLALFSAFISCSGAEISEPTAPSTPLISSIKKQPSTKGRIRFKDNNSKYESMHPEKVTTEKRHASRIKAQAKQQALSRQVHAQNARSVATEKANAQWETDGCFNPTPYEMAVILQDRQERLEKLQALEDVLNIEVCIPSFLTHEERLEKQKAHVDGQKTSLFMRIAKMDLPQLRETMPLIFQNYPRETALIIDFIVNTLIKEKTIADITLAQKDVVTKIQEINILGAFDPQAFQQFVQEYLEEHDYSFEKPAQILPPLTGESAADSLVKFNLDDE